MRRQRPGHRILSFHHRGLLLLAAAVAVMLFFLYGCVAGAAYSPRGRLVFIPLAQVSGSSTTSLFPLLSGRIGAVHRMVQCAGRYEKQARSPAEPRHHRQRIIPETSSPLTPPRGASCAGVVLYKTE